MLIRRQLCCREYRRSSPQLVWAAFDSLEASERTLKSVEFWLTQTYRPHLISGGHCYWGVCRAGGPRLCRTPVFVAVLRVGVGLAFLPFRSFRALNKRMRHREKTQMAFSVVTRLGHYSPGDTQLFYRQSETIHRHPTLP